MADHYLNNTNLTRKNFKHQYTKEQVMEFMKCAEDINYFAETFFTIVHVDHGKMKIPLYDYQKALLAQFLKERFNIVTQSRQSGKTTTTTVFVLHYLLFNKDKTIAILANKGDTSQEILSRIQLAFELIPNWMKPNVVEWNKRTIEFENGCRVMARATSSSSIRGQSCSLLIIDEAAFVENWDEFYKSTYPTIASGKETKVILVSTVNKLNHFNAIRTRAEKGLNEYIPFEVKWSDVPGRDEEWKAQTIANTSLEDFLQEHENVAMGATNSLISSATLRDIVPNEPVKSVESVNYYILPEKGRKYIITADTSHGKGLDYSVANVFDVSQYPIQQVALFRSNQVPPMVYAKLLVNLGNQYNEAYILVESNDVGSQVVSELNYTHEYENLINESDTGHKYVLGVRTTKTTKRTGCTVLKDLIESGKLIISDRICLQELSNFVQKGNSYQGETGTHDDTVMTLVMLAWFTTRENYEYVGNTDYRDMYKDDISSIDNNIVAFGFDNGNEDESEGFYEAGDYWSSNQNN